MLRRAINVGICTATALFGMRAMADHQFYAIGNSLTEDFRPELFASAFPAQRNENIVDGWHIRSSQNLNYIVSNPTDVTGSQPAPFNIALPGYVWTHVSAEPYPGLSNNPTTLGSDIAAFQTFISLTQSGPSTGTRFFIYAAWPSQTSTGGSYGPYWRQPVTDNLSQPTILAGQYMTNLYGRLTAAYGTSVRIYVIPIGDVLATLDDLINAGQVPGIKSLNDIYRDVNHMGEVGSSSRL
jgi:hypothetical protein